MVDICITYVNTNEKEAIRASLKSLLEDSAHSALHIETVIVDNNSHDGIEELTREFPGIHVVRQSTNVGFGRSHNRAMAEVQARYYFVLNPDTVFVPGENFLKKIYQFMEAHPKVGIVGPKIVYPDGSLQYSCWRFPTLLQPIFSRTKWGREGHGKVISDHFLMKDFDHNQTMPVDAIMGSAMFVRAAAAQDVGGFDDRFFMYFEDIDWCRRMWDKGWAVYFVHDAYLKHVHGRASAKVPGIMNALIKNKFARIHLVSWLKYFWKWRRTHRYYATDLKFSRR